MKTRAAGFTLIEVMITTVIIAILAAVALPAYQNYETKSSRKQAEAVMLGIAQTEERYFTNNNTYCAIPNACATGWNISAGPSNSPTYTITVAGQAGCTIATCYTITATPTAAYLVADNNLGKPCGTLTLTSTGANPKGQNGGTGNGDSSCW